MAEPVHRWLRPLFHRLSPGGARGRLQVFIYHRVLPEPDPLRPGEPDARRFDRQLRLIQRHFQVLPLPEAVRALREGRLPPRAAALSFDDGYRDNHDVALPLLQRRGLPAAFFVASGYLDGGTMWNDRVIEALRAAPPGELALPGLGRWALGDAASRRAAAAAAIGRFKYLPLQAREDAVAALAAACTAPPAPRLMMNREELRRLHAAGMSIGAHTVSHPILAALDAAAARAEIEGSKAQLEALIGAPVRLFAYPNGRPGRDWGPRERALVAGAGFEAAFSTAWGTAGRDSDPFALPRFTPWDRRPLPFLLRLARNAWRPPAAP
ncbi:MAG: polysaccharide deacetylase [Gammaproteobacteria bacterium]|nr:MAG: polysaccharide deacetylase [Gammaproteobacteria bacterium]